MPVSLEGRGIRGGQNSHGVQPPNCHSTCRLVWWCLLWMKVERRITTTPVRPHSLSVRADRVLVTSQHSRQLVEYSGDGREVGRVSLPGNTTLHHAAKTSRDTYVVCSNTTHRRPSASAHASEDLHQVRCSAGADDFQPVFVKYKRHLFICL